MSANPAPRLDGVVTRMVKATLPDPPSCWKASVGLAVERCFQLAGVNQKEAARLMDRDPGQIARWIASTERPQVDVIFAVERLRGPLVIAFAELAGGAVEIETVVRIRRRTA